jgi:hypothetical protein
VRAARAAFLPSLFCVLSLHVRAQAAGAIPVAVNVTAPTDCVTEATFWTALGRQTDRLIRATSNRSATKIEVMIERSHGDAIGELRIVRAGEASELRRVRAASCDEVEAGLSLVAALAFDPTAKRARSTDGSATSSQVSTAMPTPTPIESGPTTTSEQPAWEAHAATAPSDMTVTQTTPPLDDGEPHLRARRSWTFAAGAMGGAVGVGEPGATFTFGAFAEVARARPSAVSPSLRIGVVRAATSTDGAPVRADLGWTLGRVSVCPVRVDLSRRLTARPCIGAEAGILTASTRQLVSHRDRSRPWVAPRLSAQLAWIPLAPFFLEIEGAVAAPLVRDEIVVDPTLSVYRAPSLAPSVEIAAGVRFP